MKGEGEEEEEERKPGLIVYHCGAPLARTEGDEAVKYNRNTSAAMTTEKDRKRGSDRC